MKSEVRVGIILGKMLEEVLFELRPQDKLGFIRFEKKRKRKWIEDENKYAILESISEDCFRSKC